eukprot:3604577-Rhodomonas_salina.10
MMLPGGSGSSSLTDNVIDIPAFLRDNAEGTRSPRPAYAVSKKCAFRFSKQPITRMCKMAVPEKLPETVATPKGAVRSGTTGSPLCLYARATVCPVLSEGSVLRLCCYAKVRY